MKKSILIGMGLMALMCAGYSTAETVKIPAGHQADNVWSGKTPKRGISKAKVEEEFGAPTSKNGPTGEPPIYYWEYPDFTVYFESDLVIHTVIKYRPKVTNG